MLSREDGRGLAAWCLYDWAMSAFNTVIGTFIFAVYVTKGVAGDEVAGTAAWGNAMSLSGLALLVLSPMLGAIADRAGPRKPWLAAMTAICVASTAALWWARPTPDDLMYALIMAGIATTAFELAGVFYNALLPGLVPVKMIGRASGWGWGVGYLGGLACLVVALWGFVGDAPPVAAVLGNAESEPIRATAWLVAAWYALFSLPIFLWTIDKAADGARPLLRSAREGLTALVRTVREARRHGDLFRFLVASAFYRDGINTITAFGGIYAAGTFGMGFQEIVVFAIVLNVFAAAGAAGFAWLDDARGPRPTILIAIAGLTACGAALLLVADKLWFWVFALGLGLFFGPAQAAGRTMMAHLAPRGREGEMFGLYGFAGRAVGFMGPALLSITTTVFASQRAGMASILLFFVVGFALMSTVRDRRSG